MNPMLTEQVQIAIVQYSATVAIAYIGYLKLRADQKKGLNAIEDNTAKTVEVGVAVNGRVEALVNEKVSAIEAAYTTQIESLRSQVATLETALEVAKKAAKPKVA